MSRQSLNRTLLVSAALVAATALAGCDTDGTSMMPGRALAPISDKMLAELEQKGMDKESPILVRLFKSEAELEVWKKDHSGQFAKLKTYPICRWSGDLGPKIKEGDRQAPEGFYNITPGLMNPNSNYYLAFNLGFPNAYDQANGRTGKFLMVHGDCSSRGCYAMTDEQISEIYSLARESFAGGQRSFQVQAYPFRMTPMNMAKHRNSPHMAYWKMIKEGYDHFEVTHQEPKVDVCEKRYVFDAAASDGSPLAFNPRGKCPTFEVPKEIADAVNEKRRSDEYQTAELITHGVQAAPARSNVDGGMNPVFLAKLGTGNGELRDENGRTFVAASATPGTIPKTVNPPTTPEVEEVPASTAVAANVPVPRAAPQAKEGKAPEPGFSIASLIGNMFSRQSTTADSGTTTGSASPAPAASARPRPAPAPTHVAARAPARPKHDAAPATMAVASSSSTPWPKPEAPAARPAPAPRMVVASAPAQAPAPKNEPASLWPTPKPVAHAAPPPKAEPKPAAEAPAPQPKQTASADPATSIRSAYAPQPVAQSRTLMVGAAPVVPVGSFGAR